MKSKLFFHITFLSILTLFSASCSNDDDNGDPDGTITVNMLNEDNGKTILGDSDVYIDNANNFHTYGCLIAPLGKKGGLGGLPAPALQGLSSNVAVEQGNAYQVFKSRAVMGFPSGKRALNIAGDYYNVYVVSHIMQGNEVTGATIKFRLEDIPSYGLPEYEHFIGTLEYVDDEITLTLPNSDFEYYYNDRGSANVYDFRKQGNKLKIKLVEFEYNDYFGIYIRMQGSYTYVYGDVVY